MLRTYKNLKSREDAKVIPIAIGADFLRTKQQIISRGGKITPNLYRRQERLLKLVDVLEIYVMSSTEAASAIAQQCLDLNKKHTIYCATSPSGKKYVGKTMKDLKLRIYQHHHYATKESKNWTFSKAIRKYSIENMTFEILETVYGSVAANIRETYWIQTLKTNNKDYGYNLTGGGEGRSFLNEEDELKRRSSISKALNKPEAKKAASIKSKTYWNNPEFKEATSAKIKEVRGSKESREKTSKAAREWYDNGDGRQKMSAAVKLRYSDPEVGKAQSKKARDLKQREIICTDRNGNYIAAFLNNVEAAEKLGIPQCGISNALSGRQPHTRGYVFKLKSDPKDNIIGDSND